MFLLTYRYEAAPVRRIRKEIQGFERNWKDSNGIRRIRKGIRRIRKELEGFERNQKDSKGIRRIRKELEGFERK